MEQKVKETVIYGSLYESLYSGFLNIEDVLEYLLDNSPENDYQRKRMCISYRIICKFTQKQFIRDNHFICLTDNEDYISIYSLSFPTITIEGYQETSIQIFKKVQKIFKNFIVKNEKTRFLYVLCDLFNDNFDEQDNIIIAATRSIKNIPKIHNDYLSFILTDYVDILETFPDNLYTEALGERCLYLKDCAPLYWEKVAYPLYYNFVKKKFPNAPKFTRNMINIYDYSFPDLFSEKIKNRSELFTILSNMKIEKCSYILGFPVNKYIPSERNLEKTLEDLDELGIEKYCESRKNENQEKNIEIANPETVHFDKIEDFNPFDVVNYYTDNEDGEDIKHLFRFTRPEFENIIKDEKNFYTGKKLPTFILEEIKCRQNIAKNYNLPASEPLFELLKNKEMLLEYEENSENEETEIISDEDFEETRHIVGRLHNPETGEESFFRFPIPEDIEDSEADEMIQDALESQGLEYLGRLDCNCPVCDNLISSDDEISI